MVSTASHGSDPAMGSASMASITVPRSPESAACTVSSWAVTTLRRCSVSAPGLATSRGRTPVPSMVPMHSTTGPRPIPST